MSNPDNIWESYMEKIRLVAKGQQPLSRLIRRVEQRSGWVDLGDTCNHREFRISFVGDDAVVIVGHHEDGEVWEAYLYEYMVNRNNVSNLVDSPSDLTDLMFVCNLALKGVSNGT